MGSIKAFELLAKAAAAQNADAARAFFPPLPPEKNVQPRPFAESETAFVQLAKDIRKSINNSPYAVQLKPQQKATGLAAEVAAIKNYFCAPSHQQENTQLSDDLWDLDQSWIVPELIPQELIPPHVLQRRNPRKRRRVTEEDDESDENRNDHVLEMANAQIGHIGDGQADPPGDEDDDVDAPPADADGGEVDDDLELDADYQTGVRFDDDDGYDDPDSGAEEATF